ncbi:MAG: CBS domain-containing protein [Candidatus Aenigmarchaeota archaeon]|nr:CBS domain-containing protein [Candidatus Aenigmarchaeota archaeon]
MFVKEVMSTDVKTVRSTDTVKDAACVMNDSMIGCLMVLSGNGGIEGIVTERDILVDVVAEGKDPCSVKVGDIMTKDLVVISPENTLEEAADVMTQKTIKKLPVVQGSKLVGIVTATDLVAYEKDLIEKVADLLTISPMKRIGG